MGFVKNELFLYDWINQTNENGGFMNKLVAMFLFTGCALFSCYAQEKEEIVKDDEVSTCQDAEGNCEDSLVSYACGCNKGKGKGK